MSEVPGAPAPAPSATSSTPTSTPATSPSPTAPSTPPSKPSPVASPEQSASQPPAEKKPRIVKLKVDGVEEEYNLDAIDDLTLTRDLQMSKAAQKRMQESAELRKELTDLFHNMEKDPINTLAQINPKLKEVIRQRVEDEILEEYKRTQMTEEQRQAYEDRQFRLKYEQEQKEAEKARAEQVKREAEEAEFRKHTEDIENAFISAMEEGGLPKDRYVVAQMAQVAKEASRIGIELTPQQLAHETKLRLQNQHKIITGLLKGDKLISHLGDDVVKEVIRYTLEKAKAVKTAELEAPQASPETEVLENTEETQEETPKKKKDKFDQNAFWRKAIRGF